jgi:2,4-dienoyl-CoA reductase (NADPH2)
VTVVERAAAPGGQVRLAASVPGRAEFGDLVRNQLHRLHRVGAEVICGQAADVDTVVGLDAQAVVVATGAIPVRPHWAPADEGLVVDMSEVLAGAVAPEGRVIVVDELGFHQATSVAELLADRGCDVEVVTPGMIVGQDLGLTLDMEGWNERAARKGIRQTTEVVPMACEGGRLSLLHYPSGHMLDRDVDQVVVAAPYRANEDLYFALKGRGIQVHRAGDCVAPRRAHAAVFEGARVGAAL